MEEQGRDTESGPRWQHQWQAIAAKRRIDELQAIGALHKGFRRRNDAEGYIPALSRKSGGKRAAETTIDFAVPSSLTSRDRQGGGRRIPHFDITNISARGAPTKNGQPPRGCAIADSKISGHVDYLHDGAKVTFQSHIDYIRRQTDRERPWETCDIDMVDEPHMRARLNELSIYSNIEGGIERQRSLFEAAGRIEPKPKTFELLSSTADLAELSELAQDLDTSHFIHEMLDKLERTKAEAERRAARKGKPPKAFEAVIASGSSEQVYDWLTGLDEAPEIRAKVDWKAGRAGRIQIRFVAEFPLGLTDIERFRIMKLFCDSLAADGMMVVGAIHSPDQTNDKRNYHLHVDAYDRPAVWLANHRCWDFEYAERKNGKTVYPIRQKKVRYAEPPAKIWRQRFIDQVELIRAGRPEITQFVHGTYNENGIELTPLEHMGSRAISLEGRGIVTDIGSRNAERIWNDEKSAAERRVKQKLKREIGQIEAFRPFIKHDADAVAASKRYLELCHEKTARELQEELIDIEIRVARSRAETVIQTLTPTPGRPVRKRKGDDQLLDQAKAHLASIEERVGSEVHLPLIPQRSEDREGHTVLTFSLDLVRYDEGDPSLPFLVDVSRFDDDPAIQECFLRNHRNAVELAQKLLRTEATKGRERVRRRNFDRIGEREPKLAIALLLARDTEAVTEMLDRLEREWMRLDRAETKRLDTDKSKRLGKQRAGTSASEVTERSFNVAPLTDTERSPSAPNTDPPELIAAKGPRSAEDPRPKQKDYRQR